MKTKLKTVFLSITMLLCASGGYAQTANKRPIEVGGLTLGQNYNESQVISIMGAPESYAHVVDIFDTHEFIYHENVFYINDGKFSGFSIINKEYKLNKLVGVGDSADKIKLLKPFKVILKSENEDTICHHVYITDNVDDDCPLSIYVEQGVITKINYLCMD